MAIIMSDSHHLTLEARLNIHPVLCWVTNEHSSKPFVRLVTEFCNWRFYTDSGEIFNFARALNVDDLQRFFIGKVD